MSWKVGKSPRGRFALALALAIAVAVALAVPLAMANTATPTSSQSTWNYVNGSSGAVKVVVTGPWNWVTQSCKTGSGVSTTNVNGHYAIGFAGSWNDSTTPYTLTGKDRSGNPVTLHVGSTMDQSIVDWCANATAANPYPTGTFRIEHTYPSLAAFQSAVPNGEVCVNAYDIHKSDQTSNDWNPGKNGDNTLKAGQYVSSAMCSTATQGNGTDEDLSIVKYERIGSSGNYVRGPITGKVGDTVDYEIVVNNTGNVSLDVTLSDPHCDAGTITPSGTVTLAPGDSQTYFCTHVLAKHDLPKYTNVATANGQNSSVSGSVSVSSSVVTNLGGVKGVHHRAKPPKPVVAAANFTG